MLVAGGAPVGLFPTSGYEEQVLEMGPGDRLYLSTDGVIDAENAAQQEFGVERLIEALDRSRRFPLSDALTSAIACAERWCAPSAFGDDVSMLALEIRGAGGATDGPFLGCGS
jgi:sigma-B regulation protein RsbU (phosphoserine phosphatase)